MKQAWFFIKGYIYLNFFSHLLRSYLEPGSSSFLLKIIISSMVGMALFFKHIWAIMKSTYLRLFSKKTVQIAKLPKEEGTSETQ